MRSHMAALARLMPAPEVLPAAAAPTVVGAVGVAALVPTATTLVDRLLGDRGDRSGLRVSTLPSTHTSSKVTLCCAGDARP